MNQTSLAHSFWSHPDSVHKLDIAKNLLTHLINEFNNANLDPDAPFAAIKTSLDTLRTTERLGLFDAIEVLAMILTIEKDGVDALETIPLNCHLVSSLVSLFGNRFPPSQKPSTTTLLWSLHPFLLATLSKLYFRFFEAYVPVLASWTQREMRGMLSLCHSGADDDVFSANEYLWVSSIAQEDVNGFKWPVAKDSKTQKLSERDLGAQRVLLKRIEDIKYRWKILKMIVDDGRVDSRQDQAGAGIVTQIFEQEVMEWFHCVLFDASQSQKRRRSIQDLSLSQLSSPDFNEAGGIASLQVFWQSFFAFVLSSK